MSQDEYKKKQSWDRGLNFNKTEKIIRERLEEYKKLADNSDRKANSLTKICALYTQLMNGSRIGEACEALKKFHETGDRQVDVMLEKQSEKTIKKQGGARYRKMRIPEIILKRDIFPEALNRRQIPSYCINIFGFNTHSLRYAYIGKLSNERVPPQHIAKITGHKNLDNIINYSQEIEANKVADEVVFGSKKKKK